MFHDNALTEEQRMLRHVLKQVAKDYGNAYFLKQARASRFPQEFWNVMAQNGFLISEAPEAYGGSAFGLADLVVLVHGLGLESLASFHLLGHYLAGHMLTRFGSPEQQATYLPEMGNGKKRWGIAMVEDTVGRDPFACATQAKGEGGAYVLNGRKRYAACAGEVDFLLVTATLSDASGGPGNVGVFIVDRQAQGIKVTERELNLRVAEQPEPRSATGDVFCDVELDGVKVAKNALIGGGNSRTAMAMAARSFLMLAAATSGLGERAIAQAVEYANGRVLYSEPISAYQAIQHPMVRAKTDLEIANLLIERAVHAHAENHGAEEQFLYAAIAKYAAVEGAVSAFDIAMQAHGGSAFDRDVGIITVWPLVLLARLYLMNSDATLERYGEHLFSER